jgi:exonuclease SbcD
MKIIHTSDWHIGQTFYEYDRQEEHILFLSWLKSEVKKQNADVLLIAGDIFDSPNPSADAQAIYYRFLQELSTENPKLQVVVIAGNHDSAARLEAPNPLLSGINVKARGIVKRNSAGEIDHDWLTIPLTKDGKIAAWCLAVPYLRQGDYPPAATYAEGVGKLYKYLIEHLPDRGIPIIAMGHLHVAGSELSENDSHERILVGGLDCVSAELFPDEITYLALGHLHRAQRVKADNVRYSGSPLPMSFSERKNIQGVDVVEIKEGKAEISRLHFPAPVKLISIPEEAGTLENVMETVNFLPLGSATPLSPFLEIKVKITEPEPSLRFIIENALKGKDVRLARIVPVLPPQQQSALSLSFEELQTINPYNVAKDVFSRRYGGKDMPETMQELLQSVLMEITTS